MSESAHSPSAHRTLVCSVMFLDIEGYSTRSVSEQLTLKEQFNALLVASLRHVAMDDRIVLDTGDGAAVSFLSDPEDSLFAAINMRDALSGADPGRNPPLRVRIGINLGPVRLLKDINGQINIIGDGINDAQRVMSFAEPGKILVSRSYFDVVSRLSDDYARLFAYDGIRTDKHVREHAVYAIGASTGEPPHDFSSSIAVQDASRNLPSSEPTADEPSAAGRIPDLSLHGVRKWMIISATIALVLVGINSLWRLPGKSSHEAAPDARPETPIDRSASPAHKMAPDTPPEKPVERKAASANKAASDALPKKHAETHASSADIAAAPAKKAREPKPSETKAQAGSRSNWLIEMRKELAVCRSRGAFAQRICTEKVRWKYCAPSRWNTVAECRAEKSTIIP